MTQTPLLPQPTGCREHDRKQESGVTYSVCRLPLEETCRAGLRGGFRGGIMYRLPLEETCPYPHCPLQSRPQFHEPREKWERQPGQRRAEEVVK